MQSAVTAEAEEKKFLALKAGVDQIMEMKLKMEESRQREEYNLNRRIRQAMGDTPPSLQKLSLPSVTNKDKGAFKFIEERPALEEEEDEDAVKVKEAIDERKVNRKEHVH